MGEKKSIGSIFRVVNFYIDTSDFAITNLTLQKILYFAYGAWLAIKDRRLCYEHPEAWDYGPVFPNVYHEYKVFGSDPIMWTFTDDTINDDDDNELLQEVYDTWGHLSGNELIQRTHVLNGPWDQSYERGRNTLIEDDCIKNYFEEHYIKKHG